ncbi:unnamed protein product [Soboliphyme baturini]|uniref:AMP_N domain-containing protein n=1 Tax=Soboliphyme baturini TaxID=241478 RepID=A0A183IWI8_9BILA|nr:unnamed protein product [Soboliphyme baturini]
MIHRLSRCLRRPTARRLCSTLDVANNHESPVSRYVGQPSFYSHPHLLDSNEVTVGLTKTEYADRRYTLLRSLRRESGLRASSSATHLVIVPAASTLYSAPDVPFVFRQDSDFSYLCGFQEPDSLLVMYNEGEKFVSAMFVAERDPTSEMWQGLKAGVDGAVQLTGFLARHSKTLPVVWLNRNPICKLNQRLGPVLDSLRMFSVTSLNPNKAIQEMRWVKSEAEMKLMRKASLIGCQALTETMRYSTMTNEESHLNAKMDFECRCLGADRLAYPPVVAGGNRANTIHYLDANQRVLPGELLLMDAGCEVGGYVSDITRTWPISGRFNPHQAALYECLLEVQQLIIAKLQSHELNTLRNMYFEMLVQLGGRLKRLGVIPSHLADPETVAEVEKICPHHVGHYLGMDVHDTEDIPKSRPFVPGVVVTVEPGLYFPADNTRFPKEFRGMGMRIEDDVAFTDTSAEVLTKSCPKRINAIEEVLHC